MLDVPITVRVASANNLANFNIVPSLQCQALSNRQAAAVV
jgi:hypothetical protein